MIHAQKLDIAIKALIAHSFIRRQQLQRKPGVVDTAEEFIEGTVHVSGAADSFFECRDEAVEVCRNGSKLLPILPATYEEVFGGSGKIRRGEGDEETALTHQRGFGESDLCDEVLELRSIVHQALQA